MIKNIVATAILVAASLGVAARPIDKSLSAILFALAISGWLILIGTIIRTNSFRAKAIKNDPVKGETETLLLDMTVSKAKSEEEVALHIVAVFSSAMKKHGTPKVAYGEQETTMTWGNGSTAKIYAVKRLSLTEALIDNLRDTYSKQKEKA